jgi:hypothetical protein
MENEIVYSNLNSKPSPTPTLDCSSITVSRDYICEWRQETVFPVFYPYEFPPPCQNYGCVDPTAGNEYAGNCHDQDGRITSLTYYCIQP